MRTLEYRSTHVPAFLTKLWKLVTDPTSDNLISWSLGGTSFIIFDEIRFAKDLLPMYFKHNNMASFVRQLNMYGFRKLSCIEQGGMHCVKNEIEFYHQYFIKGQESLLELIKRKIPSNKSSDEPKIKQEYINELISNIKALQGKQETTEQGMRHLKKENKLLWRQLTLLNGRYLKQHAMLQQLLPFFLNMVQSSHGGTLKRKVPLMIHEGESQQKVPRTTSPYFVEQNDSDLSLGMVSPSSSVPNHGPVIHDVTEIESNKMFAENILCSSNTSKDNEVIVESPLSNTMENSDHAVDSPYVESESMESLKMLNCNFESMQCLSPPIEVIPTNRNMSNRPGLKSHDVNVSNVQPSNSQVGNGNDMVQLQQRCSPDNSLNPSPSSSYITQTSNSCNGNENSAMSSMISDPSHQHRSDNAVGSNANNVYVAHSVNHANGENHSISSTVTSVGLPQNCSVDVTLGPSTNSSFGAQSVKHCSRESGAMSSAMASVSLQQRRSPDNLYGANSSTSYASNRCSGDNALSPAGTLPLQQRHSSTSLNPSTDDRYIQVSDHRNAENNLMTSAMTSSALQQRCPSETSLGTRIDAAYISQASSRCGGESAMAPVVMQQQQSHPDNSITPDSDVTYMQQSANHCSPKNNTASNTMTSVVMQQRCPSNSSLSPNADATFLSQSTNNCISENSPMSSAVPSVVLQQQQQRCSPETTLSPGSYSLQSQQPCQEERMSVMDLLNKVASSEQNCSLSSNSIANSSQNSSDFEQNMTWLPDPACGNEQNIENWLRQFLKVENISSN